MPAALNLSKSVSASARMENIAYLRLDPHYRQLEQALNVASRKAAAIKEKVTKKAWDKSNALPPGPEQDQLRHGRPKTASEEAAVAEVVRLRAELAERREYLEQVSTVYAD